MNDSPSVPRAPVIVHVITGLGTGGAERMLMQTCRHLRRLGIQSHVISITGRLDLSPQLRNHVLSVESLACKGARDAIRAYNDLVRRLRDLRPDSVQCWMYHGNLLGGLASRRARVRRIVWGIHHTNLSRGDSLLTNAIARCGGLLAKTKCDLVVYCSESARQHHERMGYPHEKGVVIPNGFDSPGPIDREAARQRLMTLANTNPEDLLILHVAGHRPQKDHASLFRAMAQLNQRHPHAVLICCGPGTDQGGLIERQLAGGGRIVLLGKVDDVRELQAGADIAVLSSSHGEAFPMVLGEAMSVGTPCVATDVGDAAFLVGDTGTIVPPRQSYALAAALSAMIELPQSQRRALGAKAGIRIAQLFGMESAAKAYAAANGFPHLLDEGDMPDNRTFARVTAGIR